MWNRMNVLKRPVIAIEQSVQRSALSTKANSLQKKKAFHGCADNINDVPSPSPTPCCLLAFYIFYLPLCSCSLSCLPLSSHFKTQERGLGSCFMAASAAQQPRSQLLILQGLSRWTPRHEKAHAEFSLRWRGFLSLSHIMLPLPTLSVSISLFSLCLFCPLVCMVKCFGTTSTFRLNHQNHWHLQRVCFYWYKSPVTPTTSQLLHYSLFLKFHFSAWHRR